MSMTMSEMFEKLGAPLKNLLWSWGSVRDSDGAVFLRVWQDGAKNINGKRCIWISDEIAKDNRNLGANERRSHAELVRSGHPCYLVICIAEDTKVEPRTVKDFIQDEVFLVGDVILFEGGYWAELKERVDVRAIKSSSSAEQA